MSGGKRTFVAAVVSAAILTTVYVTRPKGAGEAVVDEAVVYAARCGICHDVEGAIGAALTPELLASYGTTANLYRYLRMAMPYEAPGTMTQEEYWATVSHLARTRGLVPLEVGDAKLREDSTGLRLGS